MILLENSHYLYFMGALPLIIVAWLLNLKKQQKLKASIGDSRLVNQIIVVPPGYLQLLRLILIITAIAFLIIALANPYINKSTNTVVTTQTELIFALDVSRSMLVGDVAPNRLTQAQNVIKEICKNLHNTQVGIVLYAGNANTYIPLTDDYYFINNSLNYVSDDLISRPGTSLNEALKIAMLSFHSNIKKNKIICLLSDGEFHDKYSYKVLYALRKAQFHLFAFGFGTKAGGFVPKENQDGKETFEKDANGLPLISRLHSESLLKIVGNEVNHYFQVTDKAVTAATFIEKFKAIESKNILHSTVKRSYFSIFLLSAIILLLIEKLIP